MTGNGAEVAGAGDGNTVDTLVQLPLTGLEPEVAAVALLVLILGFSLVQRSGIWQLQLARRDARWWWRPGAPSADITQQPSWPPNALVPTTDADRQFQYLARILADRYGVSFLDGVDAHATRWAGRLNLSVERPDRNADPVARWQAHLARELRRIYRLG
jgi:hypothetical protein